MQGLGGSYPAAHPDLAHNGHFGMQQFPADGGARAPSPLDRSATPSQRHDSNIAPPHLFENVNLPPDNFASPSLPPFTSARQPSPGPSLANGHSDPNFAGSQQGGNEAQRLNTRISELEVINDLFRGRVAQLEQAERDARSEARSKDEEIQRSQSDLKTANSRVEELQKRVAELEAGALGTPARKRTRRNPGPEEEEAGGV